MPELTRKRHKGSFGLDGNLLYLDCGGGCMGVYICPNLGTVYLNGCILSWVNYNKVDLKQKEHMQFIQSTVDGHLAFSQCLPISNSAAVSHLITRTLCINVVISGGYIYLGMALLTHRYAYSHI